MWDLACCWDHLILTSLQPHNFSFFFFFLNTSIYRVPAASQVVVKNPPAIAGDVKTQVQFLGQEDSPGM